MAIQLVKLRGVPDDERLDLYALLDENGIDYYETSAGNWGISMPALWLSDERQFDRAKSLLDAYQQERYRRVRGEYEALKKAGRHRTVKDIIRDNPAKYVLYTAIVIALVYLSIVPYFSFL